MQYASPVLDFNGLTNEQVTELLESHQLALSPDEALVIQNVILKRPPSLAECFLWSIQGSEHCSYKSSRSFLKQLVTEGPNVILGAKEDAGIVTVATDKQGRRFGIALSHESHNHPAQIVPYEGAATGVGGNLRDVSCMGAEVIAVADGLRFGDLNVPQTHRIYEGVIAGIGEYSNAVGIPNLAGDVYFNQAYQDNCLVTVVTLGLVAEDQIIHSYAPNHAEGYVYILVGKATDNSGFGGASFASLTLEEAHHAQNKGAIQEPNAFLKRHLLKANQAMFKKLQQAHLLDQVGFKDLGAGGVACATVEMAEASGYGAEIHIESIPTNMADLPAHVLLCAETQERFMWIVPPYLVDLFLAHYHDEFDLPNISKGARASVIGRIHTSPKYLVRHHGALIIDALASEITRGIVCDRPIKLRPPLQKEAFSLLPQAADEILLQLLSHENIASRQPILETYDKQVQGRTFREAGDADAGVLMPFNEDQYPEEIRTVGVALSLDQNPRYCQIDAYWGAVNAVIESVRNVAAVGAMPQAITDCLCFGNPEHPECMGDFAETIRGIADACRAVGLQDYPEAALPIVAGNVSFYNESRHGAIPPGPMISCLGAMPDARAAVAPHFKRPNSVLVLIGERQNECGGSVYYQLHGQLGSDLPKPNLNTISQEIFTVVECIQQGFVLSAHDISDGGIAVALAEMSFKRNIGVAVHLPGDLPDQVKLFSESGGFILEVLPESLAFVEQRCAQNHVPMFIVGQTLSVPVLNMQNKINLPIQMAKACWENGLREKLL